MSGVKTDLQLLITESPIGYACLVCFLILLEKVPHYSRHFSSSWERLQSLATTMRPFGPSQKKLKGKKNVEFFFFSYLFVENLFLGNFSGG